MKGKTPILIDDRVAGVCTALKTDDVIRVLCEKVRDLSFSLVSPVCTDNSCDRHVFLLICKTDQAIAKQNSISHRVSQEPENL